MSHIETSVLMERYRSVSRIIQNDIQICSKTVNNILLREKPESNQIPDIKRVMEHLDNMNDAWSSFSSWMLVVTLDDLDEARINCTHGLIDVKSKITRSNKKIHRELSQKNIKINIEKNTDIVIPTYIPYFEQLLDLIIGNAVKYSNKGGEINIRYHRNKSNVSIIISSLGPMVEKFEVPFLCNDGYRGDKAKKTNELGYGKGLFIANKICNLIYAKLNFFTNSNSSFQIGNVPYSNFEVELILPDELI